MLEEQEEEVSLPFFVLVDELDRCRPDCAISLLERIKHLFDVEGLVFVFATNAAQLQHSVAGACGQNFDGSRNLNRFFSRTYKFPESDPEDFVKSILPGIDLKKAIGPLDRFQDITVTVMRSYGLSPRDMEQVLGLVGDAISGWPHIQFRIVFVTLILKAVEFHKTRTIEKPDEAKFVIDHSGIAFDFDRDGKPKTESPENIATQVLQTARSMTTVNDLIRQESKSPLDLYVMNVFKDELNAFNTSRSRNRTLPSVQAAIPDLIRSAGQMREQDSEKDSEQSTQRSA